MIFRILSYKIKSSPPKRKNWDCDHQIYENNVIPMYNINALVLCTYDLYTLKSNDLRLYIHTKSKMLTFSY